ncbi:response regulator [Parapedobacter deserti]|uniref:histidine kinase n=1 Tax=Parapedobacter deserti TaxID=1912957 RepID=A0ABV7JIT8_9SPHI
MKKLRFKGQIYAGFVIAIAIVSTTAFLFYKKINGVVGDNRLLMQVSVATASLIDTINRQNNCMSLEMLSYFSDGDETHLKNIKNEQLAVSANLALLAEGLQKMEMGTLAIHYLHSLFERHANDLLHELTNLDVSKRTKTAEVQASADRIDQRLSLLKQAVISKRKSEMERLNGVIIETKYIAVLGLTLAVLVLFGLIGYIIKTFDFQKKAERVIRKVNADLKKLSKEKEIDNWLLNGLAALDDRTRGGLGEEEIAGNAIQTVCQHLNADVGVIYLQSTSDETVFIHTGSYATTPQDIQPKIAKGEGLIGESIVSKKQLVLSNITEHYLTAASSLGNAKIGNIVIQPCIYEGEVLGVMEIGFFREIDDTVIRFLNRASTNLAVACKVSRALSTLSHLYEETQQQAEELEAQHEELRTTNDELTHKTHLLEASEEELRVQQEELKHANLELEEKARLLEERNFSIEQARQSIAIKANELERSGRYKSEFLANMSHELRTPLNSILILAKLLNDNKSGRLSAEEVKYASVIHHAGTDLLNLINNILDLSKIESGNVELIIEDIPLSNIAQDLLELFSSVADSRAIGFRVTIHEDLPPIISTDEQRLRQVLKNLLSNAFKFTKEQGHVELLLTSAGRSPSWKKGMLGGMPASEVIAFVVTDTGIGIPIDKQKLIFDAFKQADGSTSRKFGGTGLGLSICRELATVLGGEIHLTSTEGKGSVFTLFLPLKHKDKVPKPAANKESLSNRSVGKIVDEKQQSDPEGPKTFQANAPRKRLLIIEDDRNFAEILAMYAKERGFEPLVAYQGDTGLEMALDQIPDAIILDIMLPVMDGWTVLRKLKDNPGTKSIPVHLMSADRPNKRKIEEAAVGFLKKPIDQKSLEDVFGLLYRLIESPLKRVLVVEDHRVQSDNLKSGLTDRGVEVTQAYTAAEALNFLRSDNHYDCVILDINLPDKSGMDLLDEVKGIPKHSETPVIINTAMDFNAEMTGRILRHTKAMVVKSGKSNNRILDEVNLFINKVKNDPPASTGVFEVNSNAEPATIQRDKVLQGKRVLLADDDMRNIFALSTVFASYNIDVDTANNGQEALAALDKNPRIDLVLMDIMMPEMDGYEAIAKIRAIKKFAKLPIIAITAKAMLSDRQLALEAGANDYITKPVDVSKLLSLIRVWLS